MQTFFQENKEQNHSTKREDSKTEEITNDIVPDETSLKNQIEKSTGAGNCKSQKTVGIDTKSEPLISENPFIAVSSLMVLAALLFGVLFGRINSSLGSWIFISLFTYSPVRYTIKDGIQNIGERFLEIVIWTICLAFVMMIGSGILSVISDMGGTGCIYGIGCF